MSFTGKRTRAIWPLQLIHTVICGLITPETLTSEKYFITFIDDFTHFVMTYPLKRKSEALEVYKKYTSMYFSHFGSKISTVPWTMVVNTLLWHSKNTVTIKGYRFSTPYPTLYLTMVMLNE